MTTDRVVHVIDDDADVRQSLAFLLTSAGLTVRMHDSALAFLDVLPEIKDGCVVTDVRMPGMDGLELQRRLRDLEARLPVIVMTGHGDVPLAVEAMKSGAVDFIEKPFEDETLLSAIRSALDRLVAGKANKVIAFELGISPRTVEVYRANVMTKMQAESLSELVRMALLDGGVS